MLGSPIPSGDCAYLPASPHRSIAYSGGTGILTRFPSTTPYGLALGPTYPGWIILPQETLGLRRSDFSSELLLLMPAYSLLIPPAWLSPHLLKSTECSPTECLFNIPAASVRSFSPVTFSAQNHLTSELLRFL